MTTSDDDEYINEQQQQQARKYRQNSIEIDAEQHQLSVNITFDQFTSNLHNFH
jgi:hypothetical protein